MNCPNCNNSNLDDNDIFCSNCGADIQSYLKVKKYSATKIDMVSQINSSQPKSLTLSSETITLYQNLSHEVSDLQEVPQKLALNNQQLQFMQSKVSQNNTLLNTLQLQLKKEKHDVDKLKKISVTSVIAKMKGDKEQKLKKEEGEYFSVLNRIEALEKEIAAQKDQINAVSKHISDLNQLNARLQNNKNALVKLIHQTTKGVADPVEDKIEAELDRLIRNFEPLEHQMNRNNQVYLYLNSAYNDLSNAYSKLQSASGYADWDTFFGGGMIVDSIKHSRMSDARDSVARARQSLEYARHLDPTLNDIDAYVDDISFFWDGFMDNIFSDWEARNKIHNSLGSVQNALYQLDNTRKRLNSDIVNLKSQIGSMNTRIADVRENLLKERTRMIEEAILRQQSTS